MTTQKEYEKIMKKYQKNELLSNNDITKISEYNSEAHILHFGECDEQCQRFMNKK